MTREKDNCIHIQDSEVAELKKSRDEMAIGMIQEK